MWQTGTTPSVNTYTVCPHTNRWCQRKELTRHRWSLNWWKPTDDRTGKWRKNIIYPLPLIGNSKRAAVEPNGNQSDVFKVPERSPFKLNLGRGRRKVKTGEMGGKIEKRLRRGSEQREIPPTQWNMIELFINVNHFPNWGHRLERGGEQVKLGRSVIRTKARKKKKTQHSLGWWKEKENIPCRQQWRCPYLDRSGVCCQIEIWRNLEDYPHTHHCVQS